MNVEDEFVAPFVKMGLACPGLCCFVHLGACTSSYRATFKLTLAFCAKALIKWQLRTTEQGC